MSRKLCLGRPKNRKEATAHSDELLLHRSTLMKRKFKLCRQCTERYEPRTGWTSCSNCPCHDLTRLERIENTQKVMDSKGISGIQRLFEYSQRDLARDGYSRFLIIRLLKKAGLYIRKEE